jgi:hypothetical protein
MAIGTVRQTVLVWAGFSQPAASADDNTRGGGRIGGAAPIFRSVPRQSVADGLTLSRTSANAAEFCRKILARPASTLIDCMQRRTHQTPAFLDLREIAYGATEDTDSQEWVYAR